MNKLLQNKKAFSLLEILVVLGIAGILFAVILPRAWRARSDANYSMVRQAAVELGKWGIEWSERNLAAQEEADTCSADDYINSLIGYIGGKDGTPADNNWFGTVNDMTAGCRAPDTLNKVTFTVADIMPQENPLRNPFTGLTYLHPGHDGSRIEPGLLYLASIPEDGFNNYYFIFTGAEATSATDWYAGMGDGLPPSFAGVRNGVFVARVKP